MNLQRLQRRCLEFISQTDAADGAHDVEHVKRVVKNTLYLNENEKGNTLVVLPAAWLHDCVAVPKDSPHRAQGSRMAADAATAFLTDIGYPGELLPEVAHAIEAHSFSAGVRPRTLEARIVQDADRLDSLGAIGIARCLLVGGQLERPLCDPVDPFCDEREPDDSRFTIDHFFAKLLKLPGSMHTEAGRTEAARRAEFMRNFLARLREELT